METIFFLEFPLKIGGKPLLLPKSNPAVLFGQRAGHLYHKIWRNSYHLQGVRAMIFTRNSAMLG
jgi:hypothetical protein